MSTEILISMSSQWTAICHEQVKRNSIASSGESHIQGLKIIILISIYLISSRKCYGSWLQSRRAINKLTLKFLITKKLFQFWTNLIFFNIKIRYSFHLKNNYPKLILSHLITLSTPWKLILLFEQNVSVVCFFLGRGLFRATCTSFPDFSNFRSAKIPRTIIWLVN